MTLSTHFVLKALDRLTIGRLTLHLPDGTVRRFGNLSDPHEAVLEVRDWRFFRRVLLDGDSALPKPTWKATAIRPTCRG